MSEADANPSHANPPPDPASAAHVEPAVDSAPKSVADELFAHGLLTYLHTDTPSRQGERIGRLMGAIDFDAVAGDARASSESFRFPIRTARAWVALAACLTLASSLIYFGFPGESSAQAVVQQSIAAMRSASGGDRRYEIRLQRRAEDPIPSLPGAIVDTRSPNLMLLRANAPDGHEIIAGRDTTGKWAIRLDGGIERNRTEEAWPRWAKVGDESLFVDSVDRLLEELTKSYDLQREGTAKLEGKGDTLFRHIVGAKKRNPSPGGDRVEVWIDPTTSVVERLEMRWNAPAGNHGPDGNPPGDAPARDDNADRPDHPQRPEGAPNGQDDRPPLGPPRRNGPPRDGPPPGGPRDRPHPPRGPDGLDGPEGRRGPGPDHPDNRDPLDDMDGPEGDHRGPPPPRDGPRPDGLQGDGPHPGRPGPDGAFNRPPNGRPRPEGPRGPGPGAGPNFRPGPPRALIMQRVDAPSFEEAWFTPEAHITR